MMQRSPARCPSWNGHSPSTAPTRTMPWMCCAKVGGYEIAGLAGAVLGAASVKAPIVCDGFIATAGALIACRLCPNARDYLFISHRSQESGHSTMADLLGMKPILDLEMRLGEGTGSALAMNVIEASAKVLMETSRPSRKRVLPIRAIDGSCRPETCPPDGRDRPSGPRSSVLHCFFPPAGVIFLQTMEKWMNIIYRSAYSKTDPKGV